MTTFCFAFYKPYLSTVVCRQGPRGGVHGAKVRHKADGAGQHQLCPGGESNPGSLLSDTPPCRLPGSWHCLPGQALPLFIFYIGNYSFVWTLIYTAPYVMLLMRANPLPGQVGVVGPWKLRLLWALWNGIEPLASAIWGPKKSRAQNHYVPRHINNRYSIMVIKCWYLIWRGDLINMLQFKNSSTSLSLRRTACIQ